MIIDFRQIAINGSGGGGDMSNYYTKSETDAEIAYAVEGIVFNNLDPVTEYPEDPEVGTVVGKVDVSYVGWTYPGSENYYTESSYFNFSDFAVDNDEADPVEFGSWTIDNDEYTMTLIRMQEDIEGDIYEKLRVKIYKNGVDTEQYYDFDSTVDEEAVSFSTIDENFQIPSSFSSIDIGLSNINQDGNGCKIVIDAYDSENYEIYEGSLIDALNLISFNDTLVVDGIYQYDGSTWIKAGTGSGGGSNEVVLTQQQYNALQTPDENTTYIISDAPAVDISDYCLVTSYNNLVTEVGTKATRTGISAGSAVSGLPQWNSDGVITGIASSWSGRSTSINGAGIKWFDNVYGSSNITGIYAPQSAGTAGQMLLSAGSGAPTWSTQKIVFISQSDYEGMSSHDSTTLYIII